MFKLLELKRANTHTLRLEYFVGPVKYIVTEDFYAVVEPRLSEELEANVESIVDYMVKHGLETNERGAKEAIKDLGISPKTGKEAEALVYHVLKRLSPWRFLYPLVIDRKLEDISVANGTIKVRHRSIASREYIPVLGVKVPKEHQLREYAQNLAASFGAAVNPAFPIAEFDADGRRVTIVLGSIASSTAISVRVHPERPLSLAELIRNHTISCEAANYLLQVLLNRGTVFVIGFQGSGKTTLVNALLDELPQDWKIVVIEDVPEIRLVKHNHWVSLRTRRVRSLAMSKEVEVTYRDLIRAALRLGGQVTTITEARGAEVRELLEVAALGEAVVATFHARDWAELKERLTLLGVERESLALLWAVVVMGKVKLKNGVVARRVLAVYEVEANAHERLIFRYDSERDELVMVSKPRRAGVSQQEFCKGIEGYAGSSREAEVSDSRSGQAA